MSLIIIQFLVDVGKWAMSELSQRWTIKRLDNTDIDLTQPTQIQQYFMENTQEFSEHIQQLIERRHGIIHEKERAKLADLEQFTRGEILQATYEAREREHNKVIQRMLNEIAMQLMQNGMDIKRTSL